MGVGVGVGVVGAEQARQAGWQAGRQTGRQTGQPGKADQMRAKLDTLRARWLSRLVEIDEWRLMVLGAIAPRKSTTTTASPAICQRVPVYTMLLIAQAPQVRLR